MQTTDRVSAINAIIGTLDMSQLKAVHSNLVQQINNKNGVVRMQAMSKLSVGSLAEFTHNHRTVRVRIEKLNTKTVSATELDSMGKNTHRKWRVAPSYLRAVNPNAGAY